MSIGRIVAFSLASVIIASGAAAESIKIATWNIENLRLGSRTPDELAALRALVEILDADVVAVQEVDGAEAAGLIFDPDVYDFHFSSRNDPQRTGFAIRQDVEFTAHPDLVELDIGDVRRGTDVTVMIGDQPLRLLNVHLKSFCHEDDLDDVLPTEDSHCGKLKRQIPILERWIDDSAGEDVPFVVLGDMNRRLNIAGDDLWSEIDDGEPANSDLTKHTEGLMSACLDFRFPQYIDHIITDLRATALVRPGSFEQLLLATVDPEGEAHLSDHCPISVFVETDEEPEDDVIAELIARLDAVQAELQDIRSALSSLRE